MAEDNYQKAALAWLHALRVNPQFAEALSNLGAVLHLAGQVEMARCLWQETVSLDPGFTVAWYNLGMLAAQQGDSQEAARLLSRIRNASAWGPFGAELFHAIVDLNRDKGCLAPAEPVGAANIPWLAEETLMTAILYCSRLDPKAVRSINFLPEVVRDDIVRQAGCVSPPPPHVGQLLAVLQIAATLAATEDNVRDSLSQMLAWTVEKIPPAAPGGRKRRHRKLTVALTLDAESIGQIRRRAGRGVSTARFLTRLIQEALQQPTLDPDVVVVDLGSDLMALPRLSACIEKSVGDACGNLGLVAPPVALRESVALPPNRFSVVIHGRTCGGGMGVPDSLLVTGDLRRCPPGQPGVHPVTGAESVWLPENRLLFARLTSACVLDCSEYIATVAGHTLREHASELLDFEAVEGLLRMVRKTRAGLVREFLRHMGIAQLRHVLQKLLSEGVSIRYPVRLLETMLSLLSARPDVSDNELVQEILLTVGPVACKQLTDGQGVLNVITLDPRLEQIIDYHSAELEPEVHALLLASITACVDKALYRGVRPVLLCAPQVKPSVRQILDYSARVVVIDWNEIPPRVNVNPIDMVTLGPERTG